MRGRIANRDEKRTTYLRHVIGIDAGGTKTVGLLADESGEVRATARGGGANLQVQGELNVEKVLHEGIEDLAAPEPVAAICLGIAGADRPDDKRMIRGVLRRLGLRRAVRIENDAFIALVAGAPERTGIVVVAGTGSVAYGVDAGGHTARSGGWGYLLGDEGSACWLGHAAVRLGIRAAEGRGKATTLYDRVCSKLELTEPKAVVKWFYESDQPRQRVAELASLVEEAAAAGDEAADELLDQGAMHLASAARAVESRIGFEESFPLVLSGGAFKACPSLYDRFEAQLGLDHAEVTRLQVEPATGAVTLALEILDR